MTGIDRPGLADRPPLREMMMNPATALRSVSCHRFPHVPSLAKYLLIPPPHSSSSSPPPPTSYPPPLVVVVVVYIADPLAIMAPLRKKQSSGPFSWYNKLAAFNVEVLFSRKRLPGPARSVVVHQDLPADYRNEKGKVKKEHVYQTNQVITSKYTILTFLPRNLLEQFRRIANVWVIPAFNPSLWLTRVADVQSPSASSRRLLSSNSFPSSPPYPPVL